MDDNRVETLLVQLVSDVAVIKSRLDNIDEIRETQKEIGTRIDKLEAQNERHEYEIKSLENRANAMEQHVRSGMLDTNKTQRSVFISVALAVVSATISLIFNIL